MAVIKGRFIYNAYYKSISEMVSDTNIESDYIVSVLSSGVKTEYYITSVKQSGAVKLSNGLYAVPHSIGNSMGSSTDMTYSTYAQTEYSVGGLVAGSTLSNISREDLIDRMLYGNKISAEITTNISDEVHVKGESIKLTDINVKINRNKSKVIQEAVLVNGTTTIKTDSISTGTVVFSGYNIDVKDNITITVTLYMDSGEVYQYTKKILFMYPIYYGASSDVNPGAVAIKSMSSQLSTADLNDVHSLASTCFFIAVPSGITISKVIDENSMRVDGMYTSYTVNITQGVDTVTYICYRSHILTGNDLSVIYSFKEGV